MARAVTRTWGITVKTPSVELNNSQLTRDALYYDYRSAANPLYQKIISPVPCRAFELNHSQLTRHSLYYNYRSAANPLYQKIISPVPCRAFAPDFFDSGPTRLQPLDLSEELGCAAPATSPALCANLIRIMLMVLSAAMSAARFSETGTGRACALLSEIRSSRR